MSVYTWGSSAHGGGLGFISSRSVNEVSIPRCVDLGRIKVERCIPGRGFTVALTCDGTIYRRGTYFSLLPVKLDLHFPVGTFSACYESGELLVVARDTNEVYISTSDELVKPLLLNGRILLAKEIAVLRKNHWLVVEKNSERLLELTRGTCKEYLSPSAIPLVSESFGIFADGMSGFCGGHQRGTGHLRVWSRTLAPAKIWIRRSHINIVESDWQSSGHQFYLKDVKSVCFWGNNGYGISHGELVRFSIADRQDTSTLFGITVAVQMNGTLVELLSVSIHSSRLLVLTAQGDCYCLEPDADTLDIGNHVPILSQATGVWSSAHHSVAVVQIFPFIDAIPVEGPSLQRACSNTIMRSMVTVENVTDLLHALLSRPVIDMPYLLSFGLSFFKLNRPLIRCLRSAGVKELEDWEQFRLAVEEHDIAGGSFVDILTRVRRRLGESCCEKFSRPNELSGCAGNSSQGLHKHVIFADVHTIASSQIASISSVPTPVLTPVIALHADGLDQSGVFGSEDFLPLSDAARQGMRKGFHHNFENKRVRKWKKKSLDQSPPQAPWVSPQLAPSSPPLSKVMDEEASLSVSRSLPSGSRWFTPDRAKGYSVGDLIRQEREEREAMEAVRLVEEYERAIAAHHESERKRSNPGKGGYIRQKRHGNQDACK